MRAKTTLNTQGNGGLGRAVVLALVFIAAMYAIAAALIGMV